MLKYPIRITNDGFHQYRNDYKKSSIQGTHVTFLNGLTHALTVGHVPMVLLVDMHTEESDVMVKRIIQIGVGHHPFSKKKEFKGYSDEVSPCLIATDCKAPKTVLEMHCDGDCEALYECEKEGIDMPDINQIGYIEKNTQGNRVYDIDGVGATVASQTGGLGGSGVSLFIDDGIRSDG